MDWFIMALIMFSTAWVLGGYFGNRSENKKKDKENKKLNDWF
jgi:hypothetical protein